MMTIRLNPADLTTTRSDLGLAIGTDVLAPNGSAANLTNMPADLSGDLRNIALGSAADRITLLNGIVDPLTDETDVNTSSSANETFTSTSGGFYSGVGSTAIAQATGTAIGSLTGAGGIAASFNGSVDANSAASSLSGNTGNVGKDWGSGVSKKPFSFICKSPSNEGFHSAGHNSTITLYVSDTNDIAGATAVHSGTSTYGVAQVYSSGTISTTTSGRYWWIQVSCAPSSSGTTYIAEVEFTEATALNMTLISTPYTATSAPSKTILGFQTVENEAITINTDLKGFVSRDGGSNFTEVTLVLKTTLGQTGTKYYECAETTISSTSGSSMVWKITTHNTKDIEIHGVALSWS